MEPNSHSRRGETLDRDQHDDREHVREEGGRRQRNQDRRKSKPAENEPPSTIDGILLFTFFVDSVSTMLPSIVEGGSILRRLAFPPILIPLSASVGICITFFVNMFAIVVFIAIQRVSPRLEWLLVPPLLAELYVFCVGLGLLLAALFVRFRDVGQIWEVLSQLLFFACAIFYPIGILPVWAQKVAFLNPLVQIIQDVRHAILGGASGPNDVTAATVYAGMGGRIIPILVVVVVSFGSLAFFRHEGHYFAERV